MDWRPKEHVIVALMSGTESQSKSSKGVHAVILAGGAGTRAGGQDKGLLEYQGKPMVQWVIEALHGQVESIILSVNRNLDCYQQFGFELVVDSDNDLPFQGPMAGICAALDRVENSSPEYVLVSSCDTPALPQDYAAKMIAAAGASDAEVGVVFDGQRRQQLHCIIHCSKFSSLREFYLGGGRALHRWYEQVNVLEVDFSGRAEAFVNLNEHPEKA